jgi:hypothetical protein
MIVFHAACHDGRLWLWGETPAQTEIAGGKSERGGFMKPFKREHARHITSPTSNSNKRQVISPAKRVSKRRMKIDIPIIERKITSGRLSPVAFGQAAIIGVFAGTAVTSVVQGGLWASLTIWTLALLAIVYLIKSTDNK